MIDALFDFLTPAPVVPAAVLERRRREAEEAKAARAAEVRAEIARLNAEMAPAVARVKELQAELVKLVAIGGRP